MKRDIGFVCCAVLCAALLPALKPALADQPTSKTIHDALQPFVDSHSLAGAATLVADKDKVLSCDAVGFMDVKNKKPMTTDALFWIASQSKAITAAALMILVDEGKVKLDDPVSKYIPEFADVRIKGKEKKKPEHAITVREILSHTSGLPFASNEEKPTLDKLTLREAVLTYAKTPLECEPGTKFIYSNAGINTAGRIIEIVSKMPYEEFLDKRLFEPLGMKDTTFWPSEKQLARLAKSYKANETKDDLEEVPIGQLSYPLNDRKRQPMPAGGLFSTANNVAVFCQMVLNEGTWKGKKILSKEAVKTMTSKQTGKKVKSDYGLGWNAGDTPGHGGAHATHMRIEPKRGLVLVWMVQQAGPFPGKGTSQGAFRKAAEEQFGKKK